MIQKIKIKLLMMSSLLMFGLPLAAAGVVSAQEVDIEDSLCTGSEIELDADTDCATATAGSDTDIESVIRTALNVFSVIVGAIAVVMIIVGGFRYVASGGRQESVSGAKNTILYALIGLVIVALAQIIVQFVLKETTDATAFNIR